MPTDLAAIAGALKRVYGEYTKQQNLSHKALDQISKSLKKYSPGGEGYFGAINREGNESIGAITENESFRSIDNEVYAQYRVQPKINVAPIEFSGLSAAAASSDDEAFVNIVVDALDMAKERLLKDENRQFFGLGTGLLASPSGAVASDATSFIVSSAQYLRPNMVVDIFQSTTKTVDSRRIISVDKVANRVVFATSIGAALNATSEIVKENIRDSAPADGKEMMGLRGIVDDGTDLTTFENLDASALPIWRARRIATGAANLSSDLLQRLIDDVEVLGGELPDMLIMHQLQRRKYLDIVVPGKRYLDGKMDTGFAKLTFNGIDLFLDPDCQQDTVYALTKKNMQKFELEAMGMGKHDGSDTFLRRVGSDVFQAYWRHYCNFGTDKRNAHGKLVGLAVPTGVA